MRVCDFFHLSAGNQFCLQELRLCGVKHRVPGVALVRVCPATL